jgi:holo-[acyl-carrier protein] synthase
MIGVDIEGIDRFKQFNYQPNHPFLNLVYTKKEQKYCFSKPNPAQHLAVRFAAKEAIIKASETPVHHNQINILNDKQGKPFVELSEQHEKVMVSLSHSQGYAIAFAMKK